MDLVISIYVYSLSALIVISFVAEMVFKALNKYDETPKAVQIEELISLPIIVLGCAGMIAAANNYPLFNQLFWQVYVALILGHVVFVYWLPKLKCQPKHL